MGTAEAISQMPQVTNNSGVAADHVDKYQTARRQMSPVFMPPNEFRMKLLKRILSVDGTIDNKALQRLQTHSSDRTLQANILFQNGDVGTLISFQRPTDSALFRDRPDSGIEKPEVSSQLPKIQSEKQDAEQEQQQKKGDKPRQRPLKLPPVMLPPIYSISPRPLMVRDFAGPPYIPPPVTDEEWEDLQDCRYLRPAMKKYRKNPDINKLVL